MAEEKRCNNCNFLAENEDVYCRKCGKLLPEKSKFDPKFNITECVYGPPPIERVHACPECGFSWTNWVMVDYEEFCPKCGTHVIIKEIKEEGDE